MFDVYALDKPTSAEFTKIGQLTNTTPFTQSLFGDEKLKFKSGGVDQDIDFWQERGTWNNADLLTIPRFDRGTYGAWNRKYKVPVPSDAAVINGLKGDT